MRKPLRIVATAVVLLMPGSCLAGPHQLRRSVDDWDHETYVNSPLLNAALWIVPVIPAMTAGAMALDFLVTDPLRFWFDDLWDGNGTGFRHHEVSWPDGKVDSLLIPRSGWNRVDR